MNLPEKYAWLLELRGLPNTIKLALAEYGIQEVVGKGSNKTIIGWRDELNHAGISIKGFSDDDIPWCGLFVAIVCYRRLRKAAEVVKEPLWARNWSKYGVKVDKPALGDVLVFVRNSGGHVGFYVGEDDSAYHVLGGNQSNRVSITRIEKSRLLTARRPPYLTVPVAVKPYYLLASGAVSRNEA